jgi:hypothetical protein
MSEPISTSVVAYVSFTKLWSVVAGVCGSVIPILALVDRNKVSVTNGFFMAITGSSFSIFVGPWLAQKLELISIEGIVAMSWIMGAGGVYLIRAVLNYLDKKGAATVEAVINRTLGISSEGSGHETHKHEPGETKPGDTP